jgi:hypothetical protein
VDLGSSGVILTDVGLLSCGVHSSQSVEGVNGNGQWLGGGGEWLGMLLVALCFDEPSEPGRGVPTLLASLGEGGQGDQPGRCSFAQAALMELLANLVPQHADNGEHSLHVAAPCRRVSARGSLWWRLMVGLDRDVFGRSGSLIAPRGTKKPVARHR